MENRDGIESNNSHSILLISLDQSDHLLFVLFERLGRRTSAKLGDPGACPAAMPVGYDAF